MFVDTFTEFIKKFWTIKIYFANLRVLGDGGYLFLEAAFDKITLFGRLCMIMVNPIIH